jgi:hypothetical protein
MRRFSHILSFLAVALFLLSAGSVAKANTVDPKSGYGGGGSCNDPANPLLLSAFTGDGSSITTFNCPLDFRNDLGFDIGSLTMTILTSFVGGPDSLSCIIDPNQGPGGAFSLPAFNTAVHNGSSCIYSGAGPLPNNNPGPSLLALVLVQPMAPGVLANGALFSMQWGYPDAPFAESSLDVRMSASPAPEPGSLILVGTGLTALALRRKSLKASAKRVA